MKNTPQNQYFPANAERMDVHCLESGCIGKYIPPLGSVRIHSLINSREVLILTLSIHLTRQGWIWCPSLPAGEYCIRTLPRGGMYWEIHPPRPERFPKGRGFCTPRPERFPEGEARGKSRGPRGAKSPPEGNLKGRGGCISQCIPTRGSVRPFSQH